MKYCLVRKKQKFFFINDLIPILQIKEFKYNKLI